LSYGQPSPDLPSLAASYAYGIARNHPFVDGNKRTALVAARRFLLLNGVNVQAAQVDKWLTFLELAKGSLTEAELGEWIRSRMVDEV
jgi:death-on-curing protein